MNGVAALSGDIVKIRYMLLFYLWIHTINEIGLAVNQSQVKRPYYNTTKKINQVLHKPVRAFFQQVYGPWLSLKTEMCLGIDNYIVLYSGPLYSQFWCSMEEIQFVGKIVLVRVANFIKLVSVGICTRHLQTELKKSGHRSRAVQSVAQCLRIHTNWPD